jgi:DNA-binding CsgD family transcriptional regulator
MQMKETREMVKASGNFHDKMKSFCSPLVQTFGLTHFFHAKVTSSGGFVGINLNREWEEYFFSDKSNLLIWPDKCQSYKVRDGIRLLQETEGESLNKLLVTAQKDYSLNFSLQFVEKTNHETNMYGFALNSSSLLQHMALLKEMPLLRLFIKRFQEEFKELYTSLDKNKVDLPSLLGPSFYNVKNPEMNKSLMHDQFLKKMGIEIPAPLTNRELDVIKYLIKGCSASEIACALSISRRTVEHHIERVKDKFFISSKSGLIQKALELESIGYFTV